MRFLSRQVLALTGVFLIKYFAFGIGKFLEIDAESGDATSLVACNVDTAIWGTVSTWFWPWRTGAGFNSR